MSFRKSFSNSLLQTIRILLDDPTCKLFVVATLFWQSRDDESLRPVPETMWLISCEISLVLETKEESSDILATEEICLLSSDFVPFNDKEESSKQLETDESSETADEADEAELIEDDEDKDGE